MVILDKSFKETIDLFKDYGIEKAVIELSENQAKIEGMNNSHTARVEATLQKQNENESLKGKTKEIGLDFTKLSKALSTLSEPELEIKEEESVVKLNGKYDIKLPILTIEEETIDMPDVEYTSEAKMEITKALRDLKKVFKKAENIRLTTTDSELIMSDAERNFTAEVGEINTSVPTKNDGEIENVYAIEYLEQLSGEWNTKLGDELPLEATKHISSKEWEADIIVNVAPRIEEE